MSLEQCLVPEEYGNAYGVCYNLKIITKDTESK